MDSDLQCLRLMHPAVLFIQSALQDERSRYAKVAIAPSGLG